MESINTLFLLTAGVMAAAGSILFIAGLILKTSLKYVFLMIAALGFVGKFVLPDKIYKQARKEGIIWLTVLNNGNLEKARKEHEQGVKATKDFLSSGSETKPDYIYEGADKREYRSDMYQVTVEPIKDFKCLQSHYNIIRVSIYDYESKDFYHMHYITDRDWDYTCNEYLTNVDLKPRSEPNIGVTNTTINWFASDISSDVTATKDNIPEYYAEIDHTHFAYGWTRHDLETYIKVDDGK